MPLHVPVHVPLHVPVHTDIYALIDPSEKSLLAEKKDEREEVATLSGKDAPRDLKKLRFLAFFYLKKNAQKRAFLNLIFGTGLYRYH